MDASVLSPSSKRQILSEEQGIDYISNLPDNVLHEILSLLSTKEAIRTSVLSKRWNYHWASISNIDLDDRSSLEFAERVLALHDASNIKRLRLMFSVPVNVSRLNLWIHAALMHNIQELDLNLSMEIQALDLNISAEERQFKLPPHLFTSQTLVVLKLTVDCALRAPSSTRFSLLKTLHLSKITFSNALSIRRLFSNCPILEELSLVNCEWEYIKRATICIPTLRSLIIEHDSPLGGVFNCRIRVSTANLTHLRCSSNLKIDFYLCGLPSLEHAFVDILFKVGELQNVALRAVRLLTRISNVKHLSISNYVILCLFFLRGLGLHNSIPPFYNLTHLEVHKEFNAVIAGAFLEFLGKLPRLEVLDLAKGFWNSVRLVEFDLTDEIIPSCFNSCLKVFCISKFEATMAEMELLRFLLENATVLESVKIYPSDNLSRNMQKLEEVRNLLQMLPKGSETCVIELI